MENHHPPRLPKPDIQRVVRRYFGISQKPGASRQAARRFLIGIPFVIVIVPALFYLRFGEIPPFGWGFTVFLVVLCLLAAIGFAFADRTDFHTPVAAKNDWLDKIGAFWLISCAFGPLFGWIVTALPLSEADWRWRYSLRVTLSIGLPILTALPLTRYARGKSALIAIPLLLGVTALPILTGMNPLLDLNDGSAVQQVKLILLPDSEQWVCIPLNGSQLQAPCKFDNQNIPGEIASLSHLLEIRFLRHTQQVLALTVLPPK